MAIVKIPTISAFSVASGTQITFNVVGNTNLIRSNKITIYDSSNVQVATCITNSTSLVATIPANQTGMSDGNSYYLTIDIYPQVDAGGTSMGTSANTQFWCLPAPSLVFTDPSSAITIDTTSKNFVAQFDMNYSTTISIKNKIQTYNFVLYKGNLTASVAVDTSDNIYGTGTVDPDDPNKYTISYTFDGLDNEATYFAQVTINTEQGMTISATSSIITVHANDLGFATAQVTNMPCEGYIEVQGNMTNVIGSTNAPFTEGDLHINLNGVDSEGNKYYVIWGDPAEDGIVYYPVQFPTSTINNLITSKWSIGLTGKAFTKSNSSPTIPNDDTYLFKLADLNNVYGIYLYYRDDGTNVWTELYAMQDNNTSTTAFITSNTLTNVTSTDELTILIRCEYGWYDVTIEKITT
jgi:hypothetical protein